MKKFLLALAVLVAPVVATAEPLQFNITEGITLIAPKGVARPVAAPATEPPASPAKPGYRKVCRLLRRAGRSVRR